MDLIQDIFRFVENMNGFEAIIFSIAISIIAVIFIHFFEKWFDQWYERREAKKAFAVKGSES